MVEWSHFCTIRQGMATLGATVSLMLACIVPNCFAMHGRFFLEKSYLIHWTLCWHSLSGSRRLSTPAAQGWASTARLELIELLRHDAWNIF